MKPSAYPGGYGMRAQLWRAFQGVMSPAEVDASELGQLAALLGMDEYDALGAMPGDVAAEADPLEEMLPSVDRGDGISTVPVFG